MSRDSLNEYLRVRKFLALQIKPPTHLRKTVEPDFVDVAPSDAHPRARWEPPPPPPPAPNSCSARAPPPPPCRSFYALPYSSMRHEHEEPTEEAAAAMSNYIIVKNVLRNLSSWQDLMIAASVSRVWEAAVGSLSRHYLRPEEFYLVEVAGGNVKYVKQEDLRAEPMLVLAFANPRAQRSGYYCKNFTPSSCSCSEKHRMLDFVYATLCYPQRTLMGVSCQQVVYLKPKDKIMIPEYARCPMMFPREEKHQNSHIGGISFPHIPGVHVRDISSSSNSLSACEEVSVVEKITKIMDGEIIKCLLVFAGKSFNHLEEHLNGIVNLIEATQGEENKLALGGCRVLCTFNNDFHFTSGRDGRNITILVFSIDKESEAPIEFDAFSVVFEVNKDIRGKMIQLARVPRRPHSAAIKLTCVGRDNTLQNQENTIFREYFHVTPLTGCGGQQEIGIDMFPEPSNPVAKKMKTDEDPDDRLFYSFSSIIVLFTWGKLL